MNIILGGTGHIGSSLSAELIKNNMPVTIVSRHANRATLQQSLAEVDVKDTIALHQLFLNGERLFFLNPPAPPSTDTVQEERKTLHSILAALEDSGIRKVVAASTYGARPGTEQGDLNILYQMEQELFKMNTSVSIIRSGYYMSNFDGYLQGIRSDGVLPSFYPADFALPMVEPHGIGVLAAQLMMEPDNDNPNKLYHLEGPQLYTPHDVAEAFSKELGISVQVVVIPAEKWTETFKSFWIFLRSS